MNFKMIFYIILCTVIISSCDMDSFLFNNRPISNYDLPGNNIPDSLIKHVEFYSNNNKLHGFWIASNGIRPGVTILYCEGNKHNIDNYWDRVVLLHELGVNIFIFDYRGYGMSDGESSETGLHEDGEAALNYIISNFNVNKDSLCIYGYSLGNVVSIYLSSRIVKPLCLIAEAPFASANSLTQGGIGFGIPPEWLTKGEFNNAEEIKNINTPFLFIHGDEDDFVRYKDNGRIVYNNAPEPKKLALIKGAVHDNIPQKMGYDEYLNLVSNWIFNKK